MKKLSIVIALSLLAMSTLATADEKLIVPTSVPIQDTLLPWKASYYRNFKETYVKFYTKDDCISARNYATDKIGGRLIGRIGSDHYQVGYKLDNGVETRISCVMTTGFNPTLPKPTNVINIYKLTDVFILYYKTAEKLSSEEVIKIEEDAKRNAEELKVQHENSIKSQIDTLLLNAK